ncbi:hypothetical protein LBMAG44_00140 [Gemmatimonadota bacterium]|jgi:hypothetical protein|nr:hypothetical protein LBMAG44_00140 [Gemmatimonadota bacterium]
MNDTFNPRRMMLSAAKKLLLEPTKAPPPPAPMSPPRLTSNLLEKPPMSRSRSAILDNLEEMYREAFDRAKTSGDETQLPALDFAYRREQLYFEILLDVRDAAERR